MGERLRVGKGSTLDSGEAASEDGVEEGGVDVGLVVGSVVSDLSSSSVTAPSDEEVRRSGAGAAASSLASLASGFFPRRASLRSAGLLVGI